MTIPSLGRVMAVFNKAPERTIVELKSALDKAAALLENRAKREAPVDTGRLMRSISTASEGPFRRSIGPHVNYAIYVHEGTRFQRANPFLTRSVSQVEGDVDRLFGAALERALSG